MNLESNNGTPVSNIDINAIVAQTVTQTIEQITPSIVSGIYNQLANVVQYPQLNTNLDNCTDVALNVSEEDNPMAQKRLRVINGYNAQGKPTYEQISGKTQDERNEAIVQSYIRSGLIWNFIPNSYTFTQEPHKTKTDFCEYAWNWYKRFKESFYAETTKETQKGCLRSLTRFFEGKAIEDIGIAEVQDYMNSIKDKVASTINAHVKTLGQILNAAYEERLIDRNPADSRLLSNPGKRNKGIKTLSKDECKHLVLLLPTIEDERIRLLVSLLLLAGLRREEVLGLRWEDVNFSDGYIYINRAVVFPKCDPVVKETKTPGSVRRVIMADTLRDILLASKRESGVIITDDNGKLFTDYRYKKLWRHVREVLGMPELDARQLRHTYSSMNQSSGVNIKTVSENMGHSNINTTANVYTQTIPQYVYDTRNSMVEYVLSEKTG